MVKNKYGYDRLTDPNYWIKTSRAIWRDSTMSFDKKMNAQEKLVQEYQKEKRKKKVILKNQPDNKDYQNIKNKLGLSQRESKKRVIAELKRLKKKSNATWKALKLDKEKTLKKYGII